MNVSGKGVSERPTSGGRAEPDVAVFDMWTMFVRRWPIVFVLTVLGVALSLLYAYSVPPLYESTSSVLVIPKDARIAAQGVQSQSMEARGGNDWLATHMQIVKSPRIIEAALAKAGLQELPSLVTAMAENESLVDYVLTNLSVARGGEGAARDANVLNIAFRHSQPEDAKRILDAIVASYQDFMDTTARDAGSEAANLISKAKDDLSLDLAQQESDYNAFLATAPLLFDQGNTQNIHQIRVGELETAATQLRIRKMSVESRLQTVAEALLAENRVKYTDQGLFALIDPNDIQRMSLLVEVEKGDPFSETFQSQQPVRQAVASLDYNKVASLRSEVASLRQELGEQHPKVLAKLEEITALESVLATKVDLQVAAGTTGEIDLVALVTAYKTQLENDLVGLSRQIIEIDSLIAQETVLAKDMMQYVTRERELAGKIEQTKSLYNAVVARLGDISLLRDYSGFIIEVISPVKSGIQVWPRIPLMAVLGIVLGSIGGCLLGLVVDLTDKSFRDPADLREYLQMPILAHVGSCLTRKAGLPNPDLIAYHEPQSPAAENIRRLRTALYFHATDEKSKVFQITSPIAGDGKTTLTANLAASLANAGKRVVVVDADMRRPRLHKCFDVAQDAGLSELLIGEISLPQAIKSTCMENLSIITSGTIPPNPSELLSMPSFAELLQALREDYEYVLVDTPPVLAVSDPLVVSNQVQGTILTIRLRKETRAAARLAQEALIEANAHLLGMVVNGLDPRSEKAFGYRDGYRYESQYTAAYVRS